MDWRLYKAIYDVSLPHHWVGTLFSDIETVSIPVMVVITAALWFFSRPGGDRKWKLACGSGFASAALSFAIAFAIHHVYDRPRPYESHSISHPWSSTPDATFPSDARAVSSSDFPHFERNLNTGGNNFDEENGVVAHNVIHHGAQYSSAVILPVLRVAP